MRGEIRDKRQVRTGSVIKKLLGFHDVSGDLKALADHKCILRQRKKDF
jgi:hypothetical protein